MSIQPVIDSFIVNREKIKASLDTTKQLRQCEKELVKTIQEYLHEHGEPGIRVDKSTYITLTTLERKINLSQKKHESKIKEMLKSKGIHDAEFIQDLLNKTIHTVQHQTIKVTKEK